MIYTSSFSITAGTFGSAGAVTSILLASVDTLPEIAWAYSLAVSGYLSIGGVQVQMQIDVTGSADSAIGATLSGTEWANALVVCKQVALGYQQPALRLTLLDKFVTFDMVDGGELTGVLALEAPDATLAAFG